MPALAAVTLAFSIVLLTIVLYPPATIAPSPPISEPGLLKSAPVKLIILLLMIVFPVPDAEIPL